MKHTTGNTKRPPGLMAAIALLLTLALWIGGTARAAYPYTWHNGWNAMWAQDVPVAVPYRVVFLANGGSGAMESQSITGTAALAAELRFRPVGDNMDWAMEIVRSLRAG